MNDLSISYASEASETFADRITNMDGWYVRITAQDGETAASDGISDILTALFGPAGYYLWREGETSKLVQHTEAVESAHAYLQNAFESWLGDAEDYTQVEDGQ